MALNILGLAGVIVFYLLILLVGILAAWLKRKRISSHKTSNTESLIIGGRELGYFVGIFTMTATWVGGGYVSGTVQIIFQKGLLWCQGPIAFSISLIISGIFFAKPLRKAKYVTMLDPFQLKFGSLIGATAYIPALLGEVLWSAFTLRTLVPLLQHIMNQPIGIGNRGIHVVKKIDAVEIRKFIRNYAEPDKLEPTPKGIILSMEDCQNLLAHRNAINLAIQMFTQGRKEPNLSEPLGNSGIHVVVNGYNDILLIQLRRYGRSYADPNVLFPTKTGIALINEEWHALVGLLE